MNSTLFWRLWSKPLLIGILSLAGLLFALVGDGFFDVLSWLMLIIPIGTLLYFFSIKRSTRS